MITITVAVKITNGPVGRRASLTLNNAPIIPDSAPNSAASSNITPKRSVHCRAAAAGAISIAAISTTPTVCKPISTAMTIKDVSKMLNRPVGKPSVDAKS